MSITDTIIYDSRVHTLLDRTKFNPNGPQSHGSGSEIGLLVPDALQESRPAPRRSISEQSYSVSPAPSSNGSPCVSRTSTKTKKSGHSRSHSLSTAFFGPKVRPTILSSESSSRESDDRTLFNDAETTFSNQSDLISSVTSSSTSSSRVFFKHLRPSVSTMALRRDTESADPLSIGRSPPAPSSKSHSSSRQVVEPPILDSFTISTTIRRSDDPAAATTTSVFSPKSKLRPRPSQGGLIKALGSLVKLGDRKSEEGISDDELLSWRQHPPQLCRGQSRGGLSTPLNDSSDLEVLDGSAALRGKPARHPTQRKGSLKEEILMIGKSFNTRKRNEKISTESNPRNIVVNIPDSCSNKAHSKQLSDTSISPTQDLIESVFAADLYLSRSSSVAESQSSPQWTPSGLVSYSELEKNPHKLITASYKRELGSLSSQASRSPSTSSSTEWRFGESPNLAPPAILGGLAPAPRPSTPRKRSGGRDLSSAPSEACANEGRRLISSEAWEQVSLSSRRARGVPSTSSKRLSPTGLEQGNTAH